MASSSSSSRATKESGREDGQGHDSMRWDCDDPFDFGLPIFAMDQPFDLPPPASRTRTQGAKGKGKASGSGHNNDTRLYPHAFSQTPDTTADPMINGLAATDLDQMASTSLESLFDLPPGLDGIGTDFSRDMCLRGSGMDVDLEFEALNAQMGQILDGLTFDVNLNLSEIGGITLPNPFAGEVEPPEFSDWLRGSIGPRDISQPQASGSSLPAAGRAENQVVPLAGDNSSPPQNGWIAFPPRDEHFLLHIPSPTIAPTTTTAYGSSTSLTPANRPPSGSDSSSSPSFLASPLASSASETPKPKLIWPIPVDKNGIPNSEVLRALKLPKYRRPISSAHLSKTRVDSNLDDAQFREISRFSRSSVGARSPYAGVGEMDAPTDGPTTLTLRAAGKEKGKAPDAARDGNGNGASTRSSGSPDDIIPPPKIGDKPWHVSKAPEPPLAVSEALAKQAKERRLARFSRKRDGMHAVIPPARPRPRPTPYDTLVAQSSKGKEKESQPVQDFEFQRMEVVQENERVRVVPEKPAWGKPVKPWVPPPEWIEEANAPPAKRAKNRIGGEEGTRVFVKAREPDYSRSSYGWAIAQVQDPFTSKYLILSGPHALTVRTVRPYDRLPYTQENFEGLRSGRLKKKDDRFYPDVSDEHAAVADHIEQVANLD